jgi:ABC-type multidrug transport system fused ATPase/permease subunit
MASYTKYFFVKDFNKFLFPITILIFIITEGINTIYMRFLAEYDNQRNGTYLLFNKDMGLYWGILGLLQFCYFVIQTLKYFTLNICILLSNEKIHEDMINGLVRSPSNFFDITPSGRLINKFSNDLGILDTGLSFTLTDTI